MRVKERIEKEKRALEEESKRKLRELETYKNEKEERLR